MFDAYESENTQSFPSTQNYTASASPIVGYLQHQENDTTAKPSRARVCRHFAGATPPISRFTRALNHKNRCWWASTDETAFTKDKGRDYPPFVSPARPCDPVRAAPSGAADWPRQYGKPPEIWHRQSSVARCSASLHAGSEFRD